MRPTPAAERIATLDVLRGVALLFIFVVNLPFLALSSETAFQPPPGAPPGDLVAWGVTTGLFMTKSFALFSMLFGMGFVLQLQRAEQTGRPFRALYLRRLGLLGVMGLAHGVLLFPGDILFPYAIAGLVLFLCRRWSPRSGVVAAAILMVIGAALTVRLAAFGDWAPATSEEPPPTWTADEDVSFAEILALPEIDLPALERKAHGQGPFATTVRVNVFDYGVWLLVSSITSFNWRVMAFFFMGAAMMRTGFFASANRRLHERLCAWGLAVGLLVEVGIACARIGLEFEVEPPLAMLFTAGSEVGATFLSAGYLGLVVLLVARGVLPALARWIACTGRMALTNYIGQSVLGCLVFRWYGLGLFDELSRLAILLIAVGIWCAQVVFSVVWLSRFRMGPLEWVWRRATYAGERAGTRHVQPDQ